MKYRQTNKKIYQNRNKIIPIFQTILQNLSVICKFSNSNQLLVAGDEKGKIYLFDIQRLVFKNEQLQQKYLIENHDFSSYEPPYYDADKVLQVANGSIFDLDFNDQNNLLYLATGNKLCQIYDLIKEKIIHKYQHHNSSVRVIKFCKYNENLFLSGGRDGKLLLWDLRIKSQSIKDKVNSVVIEQQQNLSYSGALFHFNFYSILASVIGNDSINVYDLRLNSNCHIIKEYLPLSQQLNKTNIVQNKKQKQSQYLGFQFNQNTSKYLLLLQIEEKLKIMKQKKLEQLYLINEKFNQIIENIQSSAKISSKGYAQILLDLQQKNLFAFALNDNIIQFSLNNFSKNFPVNYRMSNVHNLTKGCFDYSNNILLSSMNNFDLSSPSIKEFSQICAWNVIYDFIFYFQYERRLQNKVKKKKKIFFLIVIYFIQIIIIIIKKLKYFFNIQLLCKQQIDQLCGMLQLQ